MTSYANDVRRLRELYGEKKAAVERRQSLFMVEVLRPISFVMTPAFLRAGLSANQVSVVNWAVVAVAAWLAATGLRWALAGAGFLFLLNYLLDLVDGNIARYRRTRTHLGKFLDGLGDTFKSPVLYVALALGVHARLADLALGRWVVEHVYVQAWYVVAAAASILRVMESYTAARVDQYAKTIALQRVENGEIDATTALAAGSAPPATGWRGLPRTLKQVQMEAEVPAWLLLLALGRPDVLLVWVTAMACADSGLNIARNFVRAGQLLRYPRP